MTSNAGWNVKVLNAGLILTLEDGSARDCAAYLDQYGWRWIVSRKTRTIRCAGR